MKIRSFSIALNIVLLIIASISIRECSVQKDTVAVLELTNDSTYRMAQYYKNKEGELIGQIKTHELTINQWKDHAEQLGFDNKKVKMENSKLKNLVAHWQGKAGMKDTVRVVLTDTLYQDTVVGKTFEWNNDYLSLYGYLNKDFSSAIIGYEYEVDFSLTAYRQPHPKFFKRLVGTPGQLVTDIYFSDPNLTVKEFLGVVIEEDRKKWYQTNGFKIGAGAVLGVVGYKYLTR